MRDWIVWVVPLAATPFVLLLAVTGLGTLDALLFALFLLCLLSGRASKLYAVMFVLSLAMEDLRHLARQLDLGREAPWLGFTTINPPLAAGAFYCMLDMLVVATVAARRPAAAARRHWPRNRVSLPADSDETAGVDTCPRLIAATRAIDVSTQTIDQLAGRKPSKGDTRHVPQFSCASCLP